jgi:hypothetical protein
MGPWAEPGGLLFALWGRGISTTAQHAIRGVCRNLRDGGQPTQTRNALPPLLVARVRATRLRGGDHRRVKH